MAYFSASVVLDTTEYNLEYNLRVTEKGSHKPTWLEERFTLDSIARTTHRLVERLCSVQHLPRAAVMLLELGLIYSSLETCELLSHLERPRPLLPQLPHHRPQPAPAMPTRST